MSKIDDLIYDHVFKELINDGFQQAHAEQAGASALRHHHRNTPHKEAIKLAITNCKKAHKRIPEK